MADVECIPVIDLYKTIVKNCEGVPLRHCHQFQDQPNVVSFQLTLPFIDVSSSARVISSTLDSRQTGAQVLRIEFQNNIHIECKSLPVGYSFNNFIA